ncbi:hypothetical protein [Roseovarius sp.]|uniref:hypothetical protein n=1 Tax=Roseovarius sp. TaxID=1486281 RepID=UPI003569CD4D
MARHLHFFALPVLVVVIILPLPTSAQIQFAPDEHYVRCVQEEVTQIGFNARGVDGSIGPGTRGALANFIETVGLNSPPEISDDTAWPWCIMLTLVRSCLDVNGFAPADFLFTGFRGGSVSGLELRGAFITKSSDDNAVTAWLAGYHPSFQDSSFCYATEGEVDLGNV